VTVEVVDRAERFDALRDEWEEAAAANVDANVFLTWDWLRTWWRHFGEGSSRARLHLVLVRDGEGIAVAAPLCRVRRGVGPLRATLLQPVSFDAGDYGGALLVRPGEDVLDELLTHLADQLGRGGVHLAVLSRLASDSELLERLRKQLAGHDRRLAAREDVAEDPVCPYVDVHGYDLAKRRTKNRIPQRMKRLQEHHRVAFEHHTGPTLETGLAALVELQRRRWRDRPAPQTGLLARPASQAFLLDAARALDERGQLRLLTLTADGRPISSRLDLEYAGHSYMLKNAIDPDFAAFSPGHLTHHRALEDGIARGLRELDFLRGDDGYKRRWTNRERHLVAITLSRPGRAGHRDRARARLARRLDRHRPL
jgi:CelD/BcsL family acetyltransferase involved in cellulose biosynthesis